MTYKMHYIRIDPEIFYAILTHSLSLSLSFPTLLFFHTHEQEEN